MGDASSIDSPFYTAKMSYYWTFLYLFGQVDMADLDSTQSKVFVKLFLLAFMLTMMLLMLNLLIALMGDSFARTKENIHRTYRKELASFMIDQSMPTPLLSLLSYFGMFAYVLDDLVYVVQYTSDMHTSDEAAHTQLEDSLQACQNVLRESPENIASAPKVSAQDDIIDR